MREMKNINAPVLFGFISLFFAAQALAANAPGISVYFLTPQGSSVLKTWQSDDFRKIAKGGSVSIQKFFEDTTESIQLNDRAGIDLLTIYGQKPNEMVRLPRFMVVRNWVKFHFHNLSGRVSLEVVSPSALSLPKEIFELQSISKIELAPHALVYPNIQLKVRTNPAASRGEKLFEQNCMSCHSIPGHKPLEPKLLTKSVLDSFPTTHKAYPKLTLSPKDTRGLEAYRDALGSEKNEVKSSR